MKLQTPMGVECAVLNYQVLRITQGMNGAYSHQGTFNIDLGGVSGVKDVLGAPTKAKVVKTAQVAYGEVIIWSVDPVQWADGTVGHYTMRLLHDSALMVKVGPLLEQSDPFYHEGGMGPEGPNTYAAHIHMNVARGHTTQVVKMSSGKTQLLNSVEPYKLLFINGVVVENGFGYPWKIYTAPAYAPMAEVDNKVFQTGGASVRIRQLPSTDYPAIGLVPKNTQVNAPEQSTAPCNGYDWVKVSYGGVDGYCAVVAGSVVIDLLDELARVQSELNAANSEIASLNAANAALESELSVAQAELASFVAVAEVLYTKEEK